MDGIGAKSRGWNWVVGTKLGWSTLIYAHRQTNFGNIILFTNESGGPFAFLKREPLYRAKLSSMAPLLTPILELIDKSLPNT